MCQDCVLSKRVKSLACLPNLNFNHTKVYSQREDYEWFVIILGDQELVNFPKCNAKSTKTKKLKTLDK